MSAGKLVVEAIAGEMWFAMLSSLASEEFEDGNDDGDDNNNNDEDDEDDDNDDLGGAIDNENRGPGGMMVGSSLVLARGVQGPRAKGQGKG